MTPETLDTYCYAPSEAFAEFVAQAWRETGLTVRIRPATGQADADPAATGERR
jgi:hypothetical protein